MELSDLSEYIDAEVNALCVEDDANNGLEQGFTDVFLKYLSGAGDVDGYELCYAQRTGRRNAPAFKLNAWNFADTQGNEGEERGASPVIDLFVTLYKPGMTGEAMSKSEAAEHFSQVRNFLEQSISNLGSMEPSSDHFAIAKRIFDHKDTLDTARIYLITNGVVKDIAIEDTEVLGIEVKYSLWDLEKLRRMRSSGQDREPIVVDLEKDFGGNVPCLEQIDMNGEYKCYLAFFPATLLANIYAKFGPRLLEKNVRSFLQAKGKVNKGIQDTIRHQPQRFLPYNNGLSGTADHVEVDNLGVGQCLLKKISDFQIVNGGQTTASIYHAWKKEKLNIERVTVQVKLTVVGENAKIEEFVPKISLYANSQNKVNTADFSANDEWHHRLETLSRTIYAPAKSGLSKGTAWFYERARGSYLDQRMRAGTPARIKEWEREHPVDQKFTKTDVAKVERVFSQKPHAASRGAEKNFVDWTIEKEKLGVSLPTNEYFEELCAKLIIFRRAEKIVGAQKLGGYRANVVAYTLTWLSRELTSNGSLTGILQEVWKKQGCMVDLEKAIEYEAPQIFKFLTETASGKNVSEDAKTELCFKRLLTYPIDAPVWGDLHSFAQGDAMLLPSDVDIRKLSVAEIKSKIEMIKPEVWLELKEWILSTKEMNQFAAQLCDGYHRKLVGNARVTSMELKLMLETLFTARNKGFQRNE